VPELPELKLHSDTDSTQLNRNDAALVPQHKFLELINRNRQIINQNDEYPFLVI
jgi:hypothetical protein